MDPTSSSTARRGRWTPAAVLLLVFLSLFAVGADAVPSCQSYGSLSPAPQLWSAVYGSAASVTGPLFITTPVVFDLPAQQVTGGVFINSTGALYVADRGAGLSASLTTDFVSVQGLLQVGARNCPLQSVFTFQLIGGTQMPYVDIMHLSDTPLLKAIVVWMGASIEMHGAKGLTTPSSAGVSWTRLEGTLSNGSTVATLSDNVHTGSINDWQVGDRIFVGTTDYDPYQTEQVMITGFPAANRVSFSPALKYNHFGAWTYGSDQRASIGLLSRNIILTTTVERWSGTSDAAGSPGTLGTHIMIMEGFVVCHVEGINIQYGGQGDFQARYPFHWHLAGAVPSGTYFRASSIENSLFRGVTIHGTQYALVEDVVAFNITGHCWFLEDGAEWGNVINHNLAALVRLKKTGFALGSDQQPMGLSTYWLTNPNNTFTNNVAAGSEGTGVWWQMHGSVEGVSAATGKYVGYQPYVAPQGPMLNNIWHSMIHGGNMEGGGFDPQDLKPAPNAQDQRHTTLAGIQPPLTSFGGRQVLINNSFWKIGQEGFWSRAFKVDVINCTFADCGGDAVQLAGSGGHPTERGANRIINTLFVGLSENRGTANTPSGQKYQQWYNDKFLGSFSLPSGASVVGWRIYDGPTHVIGCSFVSYPDFTFMPGNNHVSNYAIAPRNGNSFFMQSLSSIQSSTFTSVVTKYRSIDPSTNPLTWSDGSKNTVVYDIDGSLSGNAYYYCVSHNYAFYKGPGCVTDPTYDMCCPQAYFTSQVLCLDREAYGNYATITPTGAQACPEVNIMHQTRMDVQGVDFSANSSASSAYDLSMMNGNEQWNTLWAVNASYLISFDQFTPGWAGFQIANTYAGDWVEFAYCLPANAVVQQVLRGRAMAAYGVSPTWAIYSQTSPIQPVASFAAFKALGATILWPNAGGYYYWDQQRNIVHLHVQSRSYRQWGADDVDHDYCGQDGCDFLVVHTTGNNSGVSDCPARAFNANSNDGSLQITSGSAFFVSAPIGPRINGPVQHVAPGRALYIDAGAAQFYAQYNAPVQGDPYFTDDRGLMWTSDVPYQYATDSSTGFSGGFDHRVAGDPYNLAFMYQSVATGNWQYRVNMTTPNTYVLTMYFMEVYWTAPSKRLFNILINGQAVYQQVDIFALSGGASTALQLRCFVNLTSATSVPVISIVAQRSADNPIISGFTIMTYADHTATYPGVSIDAGTSQNAPAAGTPPPANGGGNNGGGGTPPPVTTPTALPVPSGWVWISPTNNTYVTGGSATTASGSITVNTNSPSSAPLLSWESAQPQLFLANRFGSMSYSIPAPSTGAWQLRLLFAETYFSTLNSRVFVVKVNGVTVIPTLDLNAVGPVATQPATTGNTANLASTTAFVYAQTLQLTAGQTVAVSFVQNKDNALLCGILLVPTTASTTAVPPSTASSTASAPAAAASSTAQPTSAIRRSSSSTSAPATAPSWTPAYSLLIDVGSSTSYTQDAQHVWQADQYYNVVGLTSQGPTNQAYANADPSLYSVYNSNRYSAGAVNYTLPVPSAGSYQLRLMFAETYWTAAGSRLFTVEVQGVVLAAQFDIFAAAGGRFAAYDLFTNVTIQAQQPLSVQVVMRMIRDNAQLSGIQLQSNF